MALLKFLKGNYAGLSAKAISEGQVLICGDTGEMFVDVAADKRVKIGDFVVVSDINALEALDASSVPTSRLYYVENGNILARSNGATWTQINKQPTTAELKLALGLNAEGEVTKAIAAAKKAGDDAQEDVDNLVKYVGTIPAGATATDIVGYVQEKTSGIASEGAMTELSNRVTQAEKDIDAIEADYLKKADKEELAGNITAAQTAADNAQEYAEGVAGNLKTHTDNGDIHIAAGEREAWNSKTTMADVEAKGYQNAEQVQAIADGKDAAIATAQAKADSAYELAGKKATIDEVNAAIEGAGHAVKNDVDKAIADLETAYKAADTGLQGEINKKVDQSAYDEKMAALEGEDQKLAGLISAMDKAYKEADTGLSGRITALESDITGLSGAMHFKGVVDALPESTDGYKDGDTIIVGNKEYVVNGEAFVELGDVSAEVQRISDLEAIVNGTGEGETRVDGLVDKVADNAATIVAEKERAEAKEAELVKADADNLAAAKKYTDDEIAELNISQYAKQADLDSHTDDAVAHITADERTAWNAAESNAKTYAKDYADGLNANMNTRVEALEAIDHDHANKAELDLIASGDKAKWDAAEAKAHEHANAAELAKIADGDVAKWNAAEQNAKDYADAQVEAAKTDASNKDAVVLSEAQKAVAAAKTELQGNIDTHTGNATIHVTADDKAKWNAAQENAEKTAADALAAALQWGEF